MKRVTSISFLMFFLLNTSFGQENKFFALFPENGKEYFYEFRESEYLMHESGEKRKEIVKRKIFKIQYKTLQPENKDLLFVDIVENTVEKPNQSITNFKDYKYPEFRDGFYDIRYPDFFEGLLSQVRFIYEFDFENRKIGIYNRTAVLLKMREILDEKGYGKNEIDERTTIFNNEVIPKITENLNSFYKISSEFNKESFSPLPVYDKKMTVRDSILTFTQKKWDFSEGLYMNNFSIDNAKKCLLDLHTINLDSLLYPRHYQDKTFEFSAHEKQIQLKEIGNIGLNRFILSGKVENPQSKTVTLAILKNPYGSEMDLETVYLDENNTFNFDVELDHAGLVYLQFGRNNNFDKRAVLSFYAEPGSEIRFEAKGETLPWDLEMTGDNIGASKVLQDLRIFFNVFNLKLDWNSVHNYGSRIRNEDFLKAFYSIEDLIKKYETEMDENASQFISNELRAYFMDGFYRKEASLYFNSISDFGRFYSPDSGNIDPVQINEILNSFDIHEIYNNYGIHSRLLVRNYVQYHFRNLKKVKELKFPNYTVSGINSDFYFSSDISQKVEIARAVLTGHPLYSQLTVFFLDEIRSNDRFLVQDKEYVHNEIDKYFDLMIRVCNDTSFTDVIKAIRKNNLQWENKKYVPSTKFFNEKGDEKYIKDFLGEKPTVFYVTNRWDFERYYWDKLAEDNPELNVVMIMPGSNFQEWANYIERATPKAKQLFLVNHEQKLDEIFFKSTAHYIAYDKNGIIIGFEETADAVIKIAKQSLRNTKKELNKSQLKIIIIVLGVLVLLLIISLIMWKWRVRQRFRKETQIRKLRELELTAIRSQMNPHFLFNSLNSVQNLVQQNKGREAHLYLADFAGLIRKVLQNSEKEEVSLAEELEMTEQYLNLEKLRFDFNFNILVEDGIDINNTMVPSMILQPFAENAVIHGLQNKAENRQLKIEIVKKEKGIEISIEDNGVGRKEAQKISKAKNGKGSKLVQERLEILKEKQGENYQLNIIDLTDEEFVTRVEILIPEEK